MTNEVFRIHPAIGVARVGNSEEYYLAPETMAGFPVDGQQTTGGLPIRLGTESDHITSKDLRDGDGQLKRQAARFRIFQYNEEKAKIYPSGAGEEIKIGSKVDGKIVSDIAWTVHVANKKANTFVLVEKNYSKHDDSQIEGIKGYIPPRLPPVRNPSIDNPDAPQPNDKIAFLNSLDRVRKLTIDPGPRAISGRENGPIRFDQNTPATYFDNKNSAIQEIANYPKSFPADSFPIMEQPSGPISSLGELRTDSSGRLLVLGGYGKAVGWVLNGNNPPLDSDVNNNQWFDDTSDGPVSAALIFEDGSTVSVHGAWVTTTDPSYAPQILNSVSIWDDIYDVWIREMALDPTLFDKSNGGFQKSYKPTFDDQIQPIFRSAALQQWTTNMNPHARSSHAEVLNKITADSDPTLSPLAGIVPIFRNPNNDEFEDTRKMPLALGDANESMLTLRKTQYFFLQRWNEGFGNFLAGTGPKLGAGESLDKATLVNCLGGRFSPGIDLTFVVREPALYQQDWRLTGAGPFRIRPKHLDYQGVNGATPFLTGGYVPRHVEDGLEPGDLSKFMAIPWHTDYNSCATHPPSPNPEGNKTLFWSWPAQRPVAAFVAADVRPKSEAPTDQGAELGSQRWSVRGPGTDAAEAQNWGRYQKRIDILDNWHKLGVIMQDSAIDMEGAPFDGNWYLEVGSQLEDTGKTPVEPFPNYAEPEPEFDERQIFFDLMNEKQDPETLQRARAYTAYYLKWAEEFSTDPSRCSDDLLFFDYSDEAFQERLDVIYQELVDDAATSDPGNDQLFKTRDDMVTRIIQFSPLNLLDGAWLRNIGKAGTIDDVRALLYSILMDELGDGDVYKNHCNIYLDLCHSVGYYPDPLNTKEFVFNPQLLQSAFTVPAFELAISQFSQDYYPELLGMTLQLEWEVVDLKPSRDLLDYFGINSHFYVMHIGIDNAVNGHGQRAADAVRIYLRNELAKNGENAMQSAWRRIWNGFVAFGSIGTLGEDLKNLIENQPSLREQMIAMIKRKAKYGSANHQEKQVGPSRIDEWFTDPEGFLDALTTHAWITPGDWQNSRMRKLMDFETGPMFRVFTDDEIKLWQNYTESLGQQCPPPPPTPLSPAQAMAALVDAMRPVQMGNAGHSEAMMADESGLVRPVSWWFQQSTPKIMEVLASPKNGLIVLGDPANSRFANQLTAPTGPMGSMFNLPAKPAGNGTWRDVLYRWIDARCPLIDIKEPLDETNALVLVFNRRLRLNTPAEVKKANRTGRIIGMGAVH
jgi:hypothetical protein